MLRHFSELPKSNGYFIIEANGGLNQQRLSVAFASPCPISEILLEDLKGFHASRNLKPHSGRGFSSSYSCD
ncbi:hypothetical protein CK203_095195 [Vitis vinifera]|uniref:Uncharacterized protein n=1 Tax=Vitis vinifera TaxID=29760 RepID=A0A438E112_VITVI|nr:hypothetical protein CK203_095195 [Vitis vinifera]